MENYKIYIYIYIYIYINYNLKSYNLQSASDIDKYFQFTIALHSGDTPMEVYIDKIGSKIIFKKHEDLL